MLFVFSDDGESHSSGTSGDGAFDLPSSASRLHARLVELQQELQGGSTLDLDRVERLREVKEFRKAVLAFIRSVGPWLVELESAVSARDGEGILHACLQVERGALYVGASAVALRAQILGRLASDEIYDMTDGALNALKSALVRDSKQLRELLVEDSQS